MKKTFTLSILLLISTLTFAQDNSKVEQYCEIIASSAAFSDKVTIEVDYGKENNSSKAKRLREENGKAKKFNSIIDALNYFGKQGWKLINAFPVPSTVGSKVYSYLLKKEFASSEIE